MTSTENFEATVVITTRNRKDDLCKAIDSTLAQTAKLEILVVDDASTDGTYEMVREKYPSVQIYRREQRSGLIVNRNYAARLAKGPIIFSLDDDAVFTANNIVSDVLLLFLSDFIGAVSIPIDDFGMENIRKLGPRELPEAGRIYVTATFIGCGYAVKRDLFLSLGGYFEKLFQWGEETGFCQRLYGAGKAVAVYGGGVINHYPHGQGRHTREKDVWICRNQLLIPVYNAPGKYLLWEWLLAIGRSIRAVTQNPGHILIIFEGLLRGLMISAVELRRRKPVSEKAFRLFYRLKNEKIVALDEIAVHLQVGG